MVNVTKEKGDNYGSKNNYEKDRNSSIIGGYFTGSNTSGQFKCICLREYRCKLYSTGFVYIYADQCSTEYTLTGKAETFLEEHDDFFPASPELVIPDEMIDAELDFRHINKNPSRYGDKLMRISDAYVIQVQEEEMEEGHYLTWLNLIDGEEQQYSVYYNGELDDVFEDDTVEVTGLPLGTSSFENTEGGDTLVVVLAGCRVNNID